MLFITFSIQIKEKIRTESPHLDKDEQIQLSTEADQKQDFQTVLEQLHSERRGLLTQLEQLCLTGTSLSSEPKFLSHLQLIGSAKYQWKCGYFSLI